MILFAKQVFREIREAYERIRMKRYDKWNACIVRFSSPFIPFISSKRWIDDFSDKKILIPLRLRYSLIKTRCTIRRSNLEFVLELFVIPFCHWREQKKEVFFFLSPFCETRDVTVIIFRSNFPFYNRNCCEMKTLEKYSSIVSARIESFKKKFHPNKFPVQIFDGNILFIFYFHISLY